MPLDSLKAYSSSEISPNLPTDLNSEIVKKEWWKTFIGYLVAAIPITFGCLIEYRFVESLGKADTSVKLDLVKESFSFQGPVGAGLVAIGLGIIAFTRFRVMSKSEKISENLTTIKFKSEIIKELISLKNKQVNKDVELVLNDEMNNLKTIIGDDENLDKTKINIVKKLVAIDFDVSKEYDNILKELLESTISSTDKSKKK